MIDLFGNEIKPKTPKPKSKYQEYKLKYNYRKGTTKMCKFCQNIRRYDYHNKIYSKCILLGESHSTATDIRLTDVCDNFKEQL
jgi:hypothetical protein